MYKIEKIALETKYILAYREVRDMDGPLCRYTLIII